MVEKKIGAIGLDADRTGDRDQHLGKIVTTPNSELAFVAAGQLAAGMRSGDVSSVEVVDDLLARVEASQSSLNAFITVCADDARAAAARADDSAARGEDLGPLHGVPVSVKDIINTAGVRTTFGSRLMEDNVPGADAVAVARLKAAGAIVVGKTTTPEFAHKLLTDAPLFGTTRNPWNPDYTPGGSSGGSAAAVAAGLGPLSLATDAGASTRQPAACCGIVGMKPTLGRLPHNQVPDGFANFIHLGVMARTVADAALMLGVMAGPDGSDPFSLASASGGSEGWTVNGDALNSIRGKRLAWRALLGNEALDGEVRTLCEHAIETLGGLGAEVEAIDDPVENAEPTWRVLQQSNWAARFGKDVDANEKRMDPGFVAGIREGGKYSATQLQQAMYKRTRIFRSTQAWFDEFDLIVTPTLSRPPLKADHKASEPIDIEGVEAGDIRAAWVSYLNIFNLTGHPAVSVPCGWTAGGLPVGLQIVGRWRDDAGVLAAAAALEQARPWAERRPGIR
jgi:aspartyl-tRNA(Asn)/glutamyl-tRNA(Gln) amidotransferase subunit A